MSTKTETALTDAELDELIGLIHSVEKTECSSTRDLMRHESLRRKATRAQFVKAYRANRFPLSQIKKMLWDVKHHKEFVLKQKGQIYLIPMDATDAELEQFVDLILQGESGEEMKGEYKRPSKR